MEQLTLSESLSEDHFAAPQPEPAAATASTSSDVAASSPPSTSAAAEEPPKPKCRICCACPDTRKLRDECIIENGEEMCLDKIEMHKQCLRAEGFAV